MESTISKGRNEPSSPPTSTGEGPLSAQATGRSECCRLLKSHPTTTAATAVPTNTPTTDDTRPLLHSGTALTTFTSTGGVYAYVEPNRLHAPSEQPHIPLEQVLMRKEGRFEVESVDRKPWYVPNERTLFPVKKGEGDGGSVRRRERREERGEDVSVGTEVAWLGHKEDCGRTGHRLRTRRSLEEDVLRIEDEELRRLTGIAYLT